MTDVAIDPQEWYGNGIVDIDGAKLGKIHDIYLDTGTDQPQWLAVKIGAVVALVPFTGAKTQGNVMRVAYTMDRIQEAYGRRRRIAVPRRRGWAVPPLWA